MSQDVALAGEIEVGVLRQVEDGGLVGGGGEIKTQAMIVGQGINGFDTEVARVAFFAVLAQVIQGQGRRGRRAGLRRLPNLLVETLESAMEGVGAIIGRQRISDALQLKGGLGDAIGKSRLGVLSETRMPP